MIMISPRRSKKFKVVNILRKSFRGTVSRAFKSRNTNKVFSHRFLWRTYFILAVHIQKKQWVRLRKPGSAQSLWARPKDSLAAGPPFSLIKMAVKADKEESVPVKPLSRRDLIVVACCCLSNVAKAYSVSAPFPIVPLYAAEYNFSEVTAVRFFTWSSGNPDTNAHRFILTFNW